MNKKINKYKLKSIMSKFINSCVNYSESDLLKTKLLKPLLIKFNEHLVNVNSKLFKNSDVVSQTRFLIPNNNIKYYLFITNKSNITNTTNSSNSSNYKILYFFPESKMNQNSDFYMEIDDKIGFDRDNYLFEGYLYNKNTYLITDILFIDNKLFDVEYTLRFSLINEIIEKCNLKNINGYINISIHQYLNSVNLLKLLTNNFIFKDELKSVEYLNNVNFEKTNELNKIKKENAFKILEKTKYIEVYKVYNNDSKNYEGLLYVPTLQDSKKLKELKEFTINCKWNTFFNKWQPNF